MKTIIVMLILLAPTFSQSKSHFWEMYERDSIPEKKEIWNTLTKEEQVEARRMNFAWGVGYLNLNDEQIEFLQRFSAALPNITRRDLNAFQAEAVDLFPTGGDVLFGSIGPYKPCSLFTKNLPVIFQQSSCPCSVGSGFNMSCDGECTAAGTRCTVTNGGCGFAWMYSCNGFCLMS